MKRFRPHCGGFILLYALTLLSIADVIYSLFLQNNANSPFGGFGLLSVLICALAFAYTWMFVRAQVAIGDGKMRIAWPANIQPKAGESRPIFIYRQGNLDLRFIDKCIRLDSITQYGYVEDLGYERIDKGPAGPKNKLFPVHEVAIITSDNKRYHMNAAIYSARQRREIFTLVREKSGTAPQGALADELK